MVEIAILALCVLASLATGLFVVFRNPKHRLNQIYGILTLALVLYSISNYLSLQTTERLLYIRVVILMSTIIVAGVYYLVLAMEDKARRLSFWQMAGVYVTLVVALLDISPFVFKGLTGSPLNPVPAPSIAAPIFAAHLVGFLALDIGLLARRLHRSSGLLRLQYFYLLLGMLPMFLFAPFTGFIMPVLMQNASLIVLNPIYGAVLVCAVGYAIVRHKLFDVRLIVARSLGYALSLVIIASVYGFVAFGLSQLLFDLSIPLMTQVALSLSTGLAVVLFSQLKPYFDKLTNTLFFRDAYDARELFDEYNRALVSTIDLGLLLRRTSAIISKYLQSEFCVIGVKDGSDKNFRLEGTVRRGFNIDDITLMRTLTSYIHQTVIIVDELPADKAELRKILSSYNISILVRLSTDIKKAREGMGYIALGPKKSGNLYTKQDVAVIEALANELIIALQNALRFEEIERFNETLQQKVTDATRQLRETNKKLKQLNESKDDFIGMASHQLRTPLTSIKGYVSLVMDGDAGPVNPQQVKLLQQAFNSSQKMVYLIADLLNVSRLNTGKFVIERSMVKLDKLIGDEMSQLKAEAASRGLELTFEAPKDFPALPLDETKTRQVVMNFLDNAIYYTPSGGKVRAVLACNAKSVEFRVVDDGIGVPKADRHRLFTKFYRAHNAQRARPDGTGLGLYMAQKVITAQGGAIIFDSEEGKGSTFGFMFPKVLPHDTVVVPAQSRQ